jgi:DNA-binding response OmpR family regulator
MKILIVEDDKKLAGFISKGLKEAGFSVVHMDNGEDGLHMITTELFDAAIVDIMLPKLDGLTLIEQMRMAGLNTPVLILSAKREVDDRVKGLQSGGDDYLTKPFAFTELLARIQALLRRASNTTDPSTLSVADLTLNILTREVKRGEKVLELQPREFVLLEYLMRNAGKVVSKTMIMEHVWDYNFDPQTNVVEVRICRLRDKVDKGFHNKLIHTIRGAGYVLKETA